MAARFSLRRVRSNVLPFWARRRRRKGIGLFRGVRRYALVLAVGFLGVAGWQFLVLDRTLETVTGLQGVRVVDGDTIWLKSKDPVEKIRIVGLDTPETFRAQCDDERRRGLEAKARLVALLSTGNWSVERTGRLDRYGRTLARVLVDGQDVATTLISEGYARPYNGGPRRGWCR